MKCNTSPESPAPTCLKHEQTKVKRSDKSKKYGFRWTCLACSLESSNKWREANPEKRAKASREAGWKRIGIVLTYEEYLQLLEDQDHKCLICEKPDPRHVDHCHISGKVRGILCGGCNKGMGHFQDDPELLEKAAAYLRQGH